MDDTIKVLSNKFDLSKELLQSIANDSPHISNWLSVLARYILENEKSKEDQKSKESALRKERLNAEYQISLLDKQLISCNSKLSKYEQNLLETKIKLEKTEEALSEFNNKFTDAVKEKSNLVSEIEQFRQLCSRLEHEKADFAEILEKKNSEIDRINEEWSDMSKKLSESNKIRYRLQYDLDEIKNSDIRKEFKEKRLEQEKSMLLQQIDHITNELKLKSELLIQTQRDQSSKFIDVELKYESISQENVQLKSNLEICKETCAEQEKKLKLLMSKIERISDENIEVQHNMQQELSSQTKLVELYKDDRDHAKQKLSEISAAFSELQSYVLKVNEEKSILAEKLKESENDKASSLESLTNKIKEQATELENANRLLQVSKKKDNNLTSQDLSSISPMAAATSSILKKGMTLTQIYTEYVKISDQLASEKEENSRLKMYMEQILREVEEKAPVLLQQKEEYDHAVKTIETLSYKLEQNIKECRHHQNQLSDYERKFEYYKREEKRLHNLSVDLSKQVCVLLKEIEEARGGVVSSSNSLPELLTNDAMVSSSCQVISDHLVTFKSIEELQSQNKRLLVTVRELSEEQEKLEIEGGSEIIQELKRKFANARDDLNTLKENEKTQQEMMQQIIRQRDMYKLLCKAGNTMVGEVSSTSTSLAAVDLEAELNKLKADLEENINEYRKYKEEASNKELSIKSIIEKQLEELSLLRTENNQVKAQLDFSNEKYSILMTTAEGYKKEIKALEEKCQSITNSLSKYRVEAESAKQSYHEMREKLITCEVSLKSLSTEKYLIQEAEKRLMQENQSLLDQHRSQSVLLANLQTIQNNLEKQEFDTRISLSKQCEALQREMKVIRRNFSNEEHNLKSNVSLLENECKDLKVKLGVETELQKKYLKELEETKQQLSQSEAKCKELEALTQASDNRLAVVLQGENISKENEETHHEIELLKIKLREMELTLSNNINEKKTLEEQLIATKKHLEQYKEIGDSNEHAITTLANLKDSIEADLQSKIKIANEAIENFKKQVEALTAEKIHLNKKISEADKAHQFQVSELRNQMAPLERRFQEVTRALVNAKELEESAVKEAQTQAAIAKEAQDKYERELILHAKDVEQFTLLKEDVQFHKNHHEDLKLQISEINKNLENNNNLMEQMKHHHQIELRKGEIARKDLIDENSILHSQVEKLSAQLAAAKSHNPTIEEPLTSSDKSLEEVYELLRFVRREKEIAETKAEACKTESMRFRQRAEHLQRDIDETKAALELEMKRTQGHMLSEEEYKDVMEKVNKVSEFEVLNNVLEKEKLNLISKNEQLRDQVKKLEIEMKPLLESKKALDGEKNVWLAEKTALKSEIERWTNRTNQLMIQSTKSENEELKKLQSLKVQNEKVITSLQEDLKRNKQQFDTFKRETLKFKNENQEKISGLESDLIATRNKLNAASTTSNASAKAVETEQLSNLQKELDQWKSKNLEMADKSKMVRKVARKYKTICDQLQKVLKENNIDFSSIINVSSNNVQSNDLDTPSNQTIDLEEKKKFEIQIAEKTKVAEELSKELMSLQSQLVSECKRSNDLEKKNIETHSCYLEAEKKLLEKNKELELLKLEFADGKKKLTEVQEKNKKLLKTCKEKLSSLTKLKDSSSREIECLKDQLEKSRVELRDSNESNSVHALEERLLESTNQIKELILDKKHLIQKLDELQNQIDKMGADLIAVDNCSKNEKKTKIIVEPKQSSDQQLLDTYGNAPLTATVRPTATSSQAASKFHVQNTRTASIRPLAHGHPTAMISPTVPTALSSLQTPVASVSALPVSSVFLPHVCEMQVRPSYSRHSNERQIFTAPVARVSVQVRADDINDDISTDEAVPISLSLARELNPYGNKRSHQNEVEEKIEVLDEEESIEPGSKRQRVESNLQEHQLETAIIVQHDLEEDDLLSEENVEEVTIEGNSPTDNQLYNNNQNTQLQIDPRLQSSLQEILRQRQYVRESSQMPLFSFISGPGNSFYEETDDSMVPSTPTLFLPKRIEYAEAISSIVRYPSQGSSVPHPEFNEVRSSDDSANVPHTPLSVVPNVSLQQSIASSFQLTGQENSVNKFFGEDSNLQHVPQHVTLTEEEDINETETKDDAELMPSVQIDTYESKTYTENIKDIPENKFQSSAEKSNFSVDEKETEVLILTKEDKIGDFDQDENSEDYYDAGDDDGENNVYDEDVGNYKNEDKRQIKETYEDIHNDEVPKSECGSNVLEEITKPNEESENALVDANRMESDDDISRDATEPVVTELETTGKDEQLKKTEDEKTKPVRLQRGVRPRLRRDLPSRLAKASDLVDKTN
ncbi:nucleoprotein TPR-like isoform X1 [Hydra vulgaris]|uniref:Nucleoprotein TPR n=1 Tax=Hydra vulgaris TaxID=6087 RepID=A0ABM4DNI2_HYDVU